MAEAGAREVRGGRGSARRGGSGTCGPRARWPPASWRLPRAACRSPWPRCTAQIRTRSKCSVLDSSSLQSRPGSALAQADSAPPGRAGVRWLEQGWSSRHPLPHGDGAWSSEGAEAPAKAPQLEPFLPGASPPVSSPVSLSQQRGVLPRLAPILAFSGGTYINLELFRGSESPMPRPPHHPRLAPGHPLARCLGAARHRLSLFRSQSGRVDRRSSPGCGWQEAGARPGG
ncbi:uncharacterized protein LOC117710259 [Arvicanthis niloticus]|uniref:uncharacterized protein LOC117710259 n=1 Tax=Arvicanthis niloticus TaxID=61156 RepID=UPI00402B47B5